MKTNFIILFLAIITFSTPGFRPNLGAQEKKPVKPTLAVLPFSSAGVKEYEAISLSNRLHSELVKTGRFQVVELEKVEALLKEIAWEVAYPKSKRQQVTEDKGSKKWLWLLGGTALVGGGITALMLLKSNDNGGASEVIGMPPEPPK